MFLRNSKHAFKFFNVILEYPHRLKEFGPYKLVYGPLSIELFQILYWSSDLKMLRNTALDNIKVLISNIMSIILFNYTSYYTGKTNSHNNFNVRGGMKLYGCSFD